MPLTAKQLIINNLLVNYYHRAGSADKPTLVFLHGWRSEGSVWNGIIEQLDDDYTVYALDLPGFGRSQAPESFTLQDYAGIVDEFIKKHNLDKVVIIGHSFGGRIAIKLATTHPGYLNGIVLSDSAGIRQSSRVRSLKQAAAKVFKPVFKLPFLKNTRKKLYEKMGAVDYLAIPRLQKTFINIINEDLTPILSNIKIPALLMWGSEDRDTPLEHARVIQEKIPGSKLVILENAGHFSFADKPQEFTQNLKDFLKKT